MSLTRRPLVSIYIPTFNRAHLLEKSINSVRAQSLTDWELIIIDDGSRDETQAVVKRLTGDFADRVKYVYHDNRGLFYCRNRGVDLSSGRYIAPLDSDDAWERHHLEECVQALEDNPDVDWVYGALRRVDGATGDTLVASNFYSGSTPQPFLELQTRRAGSLRIIEDDSALRCAVLHGLHCGQQVSVIRRWVLEDIRFSGTYRICEDQQYPVRALLAGARFGYFDRVHLNYYVHDSNISSVRDSFINASERSFKKAICVQAELIAVYEELLAEHKGNSQLIAAVRERLAYEYFWVLGYSLCWNDGRYGDAFAAFRKGLRYRPLDFALWKSYCVCLAKAALCRVGSSH
jgi:glycosyltransferase involved in cell wall biosynthesis